VALRLRAEGKLRISHETIYRYIWRDKEKGGLLHLHLRQQPKLRRKRYRSNDHRGVLQGKRHIDERPQEAKDRSELGHFEIDLVHGKWGLECIMTLVDRKSRFLIIRKLRNKTMREVNRKLLPVIRKFGIKTITADNGCEFHGYKKLEAKSPVKFYFATPHHSWERGTVENTNGLIRQYLPKKESMTGLEQYMCNWIARKINRRPKKVLSLKTPEESHGFKNVALQS
jgi:IS30 family transposase